MKLKSHINEWKNKEVFESQLELNEKELDSYPIHWNQFLYALDRVTPAPKNILDMGCGVGVYYELCKRHHPELKYSGIDYSSDAIQIARRKWEGGSWKVKSYEDLTSEDAKNYDLLHAGALLDVLPNGDEAFSFLLSLGFKNIIFGRVKLTHESSYSEVYKAYDKINTYAYYHNAGNLLKLISKFEYYLKFMGEIKSCTLLLTKNQLP